MSAKEMSCCVVVLLCCGDVVLRYGPQLFPNDPRRSRDSPGSALEWPTGDPPAIGKEGSKLVTKRACCILWLWCCVVCCVLCCVFVGVAMGVAPVLLSALCYLFIPRVCKDRSSYVVRNCKLLFCLLYCMNPLYTILEKKNY